MLRPRITVVYYSATGTVHRLATAFVEGAQDAGAEVRLRRVAELAPEDVIAAKPAWRAHRDGTAHIPEVELDDLRWAQGLALGTPTRFGNVSAQLKQFLDTTSALWLAGELADKPATGFSASVEPHGGQESTLLALYNVLYHWGAVIVPPGWVDYDIAHAAGGNPYGISLVQSEADANPDYAKAVMTAARWQGGRLAAATRALAPLHSA